MTADQRPEVRRRPFLLVFLLLVPVLLLGFVLVNGLSDRSTSLLGLSECTVETSEGDVGLSREEAQRATTTAALLARGSSFADIDSIDGAAGIDEAVMQRLIEGPPDDAGPSLSCRGTATGGLEEEPLTASGLTPRAEKLRDAMTEVFGESSLGGFAPGGVSSGHGAESTHYDGRAVDVFFRPVTEENRRQGWILSQWLVAHAGDYNIQYVIFDDQFWSAHLSRGQWHPYDAPDPENEILRHLDHVHVDVLRGEN